MNPDLMMPLLDQNPNQGRPNLRINDDSTHSSESRDLPPLDPDVVAFIKWLNIEIIVLLPVYVMFKYDPGYEPGLK